MLSDEVDSAAETAGTILTAIRLAARKAKSFFLVHSPFRSVFCFFSEGLPFSFTLYFYIDDVNMFLFFFVRTNNI